MEAVALLLSPENLFVNAFCGLSAQFVYLALMTRVLPPRSARTFWTVEIVYQAVTLFLKPLYPVPLRIVIGTVGSLVIPLLLLRGRLLRRIVICVLCMSMQTAAELVAAVVWMGLTGLQIMDNHLAFIHAHQFMASVVAEMVALAFIMNGLRWLCLRFFPLEEDSAGAKHGTAWLRWAALFPLIQMMLIYTMVWIAFDVTEGEGAYMVTLAALLGLCVAADVLLFVQMDRSFRQRRAEMEAALLEAQVGSYLGELAAMQRLLDDTARLRHDLRNHQSVVRALCDGGDYAEAHRYLEGARDLVGR